MSPEEFSEWKTSVVTQEVMKLLERRCYDIAKTLTMSAGKDPLQDRFYCGMVTAFEQMLAIDFEETQPSD